jgi:hypothetical protein
MCLYVGSVRLLDQPVVGVEVSIPELKRYVRTNGDGGFAFGYGSTDSVNQEILESGHRLTMRLGQCRIF